MSFEWSDIQLGDFVELKRGYDLPHKDRKEGDYKVISSSGPSGFHSEGKVKGPGVVTGRYGTIGKVFYSERDFWPLNTTLYVKDFKGNYPEFVYYFLKTLDFLQYSDKAAVPGVNRNHLHTAWVKVPESTEVQEKVAKFLSDLDKKMTLNTQINQTLERMAQALFKSWFVDFDPVIDNALEAGNPIPEPLAERAARRQAMWEAGSEKAPARLPAKTRRLFPDSFEEDEVLGWVPVGWKVGVFADIANNIRDGVGPDKIDEKDHYVGLEHIDRISLSLQRWGDAGEVSSNKSKFEENDVLFGKLRPYFHKVCIAPFEGICSTDILVLRAKEENLRAYVSLQAFEAEFVEYANLRSTGTRMPRASWKDISQYELVIPEDMVLKHFEKVIGGMLAPLSNNIFETKTLAQLRDTLLPKLLSGELQLPEAEAAVETALEVEPV